MVRYWWTVLPKVVKRFVQIIVVNALRLIDFSLKWCCFECCCEEKLRDVASRQENKAKFEVISKEKEAWFIQWICILNIIPVVNFMSRSLTEMSGLIQWMTTLDQGYISTNLHVMFSYVSRVHKWSSALLFHINQAYVLVTELLEAKFKTILH